MTLAERAATAGVWTVAGFATVFLLTPLVVTVIVSFGSSAVFSLPPPDWSFRWYERLPHLRGLTSSLWTSVQIAVLSTFISMVLGVLAAIALARGRFPGREAIAAFLTSPLMLPGLVLGISLLQAFRFVGLRDIWFSLLFAHIVITLPYTVRTLYSALTLFDFALIDAARTLGCSPTQAVLRVLLPNLAPACLTSGIFAFLASMDNYAIAIFFTNAFTKTLPIQMLNYVEEQPDPTIAAISSMLILLVLLLLVVCGRVVGLRRITDL
jgi:putative spermidine/putrescine transport system permease protein